MFSTLTPSQKGNTITNIESMRKEKLDAEEKEVTVNRRGHT